MSKKKKRYMQCDPTQCEEYVEQALGDFKEIANKIAENQVSIQVNIAKLTESLEGIKRLNERVEKVEDKVDSNSALMYKMVGIGMAGAAILPLVVQKMF